MMRFVRRKLTFGTLIVMIIAALGYFSFNKAVQYVPDYYEKATLITPERLEEGGDEFEKQVFELHNQWQRADRWEATFTDSQINGWLAVDLVEKFPDLLPDTVADPRVAIDDDCVRLAYRYQKGRFDTVFNLALKVYLTEEPNVVALRLLSARAGLISMPMQDLMDGITAGARRAGLRLRWTQQEGDPLALITLPARFVEGGNEHVVELIEQGEGYLTVGGRPVESTP